MKHRSVYDIPITHANAIQLSKHLAQRAAYGEAVLEVMATLHSDFEDRIALYDFVVELQGVIFHDD